MKTGEIIGHALALAVVAAVAALAGTGAVARRNGRFRRNVVGPDPQHPDYMNPVLNKYWVEYAAAGLAKTGKPEKAAQLADDLLEEMLDRTGFGDPRKTTW